ncbi:MAG: sulfurtransferase-like selenium metabolism protein YedF [Selenomonadales bacterium]|nr:sulfurtransferase-like selenium metabolism protein YedF [Selenomonadales bacterium]
MRIVDNRGLNCPLPVINTKRALEEHGSEPLVSVVDNDAAKSNVEKLARSLGYRTDVRQEGTAYYIAIRPGEPEPVELSAVAIAPKAAPAPLGFTLYVIAAEEVGRGSAELGRALLKTFLYALAETGEQANRLVFLHGGAHVTCEGSPLLPSLQRLEANGWSIATCGACLDFYALKDKLAIGEITNMYSIVELMRTAHKVVSL